MKLRHGLAAGLAAALLLAPAASAAPTPTYHLRIRAVLAADDDGSHAATVTGAQITTMVNNASTVWAGAGIVFDFDPATDIENRNSTVLNNDCTIVDLIDDVSCDTQPNVEAREALGLDAQHDGKITVFFRWGGNGFTCTGLAACSVTPATGAFSSRAGHYVAMRGSSDGAFTLAHELGHYLWNSHTFGPGPKTAAEAAEAVRNYVEGAHPHPRSEGLNVFDGDLLNGDAADTPPDPGPSLWQALKGDACADGFLSGTQALTVTFSDQTQQTYSLSPNRSNIMSYYVSCPFPHTSSPQQQVRARNAVDVWNRGQLIGKAPAFADLDQRWQGTSAVGDSVTPFMFKRRPNLLIYNRTTGNATIERVQDNPASGTHAYTSANLGAGWTTIMPFDLSGEPHALVYNATNGQAKIIKLIGTLGWSTPWQGGFKTGWTNMLPFQLGGAPHALLYNSATGAAKIIRLLGAQGWSSVWEGGFKTSWTSLVPIELGGAPHALLYNSATGAAKIIRLLGAEGWSSVWEGSWSTGWTAFMPFDRGPRQRLLAYKSASGQLNAVEVRPDGAGLTLLSTTSIPAGYDWLVPVRLLGLWYGYAYDTANAATSRLIGITQ